MCDCLSNCCDSCCCDCCINCWDWMDDMIFKPICDLFRMDIYRMANRALFAIFASLGLMCIICGLAILDITFGAVYFHSDGMCTTKVHIPLWLILKGGFFIMSLSFWIVTVFKPRIWLAIINVLTFGLSVSWMILGWVMFLADCRGLTPANLNDYMWFTLIFQTTMMYMMSSSPRKSE